MARSLYFGLTAVLASSLVFALVIFNYGVSWMGDSVKAITELASMYDLEKVGCALYSGYCNLD
jgi:hypothetical protein